MIEGPIEVGEILWWSPHDLKAFERVKVSATREKDGILYIETENVRTLAKFWNREVNVRAMCKREEKRKTTPKTPERKELGARVSGWPEEWQVEFQERWNIREFDGGMWTHDAKKAAEADIRKRYAG